MPNTRQWLPNPVLSIALTTAWLLLNNTLAPGHILLGLALGLALPVFTSRFWPGRPAVYRPLALIRLLPVMLWDIVVANVTVARLILNPARTPQPRFMRLPLDLRNEYAITILAGLITLTPGTVSADLSPDRTHLLIHSLDIADERAAIARIKARYEAPLKEAFEC